MIRLAVGFILTITGLMLAAWFVQVLLAPEEAPWPSFIVGAIAAAMISVGLRYLLRSFTKKKD